MDKTKVDLNDNLILRSENIEYNNKTLKEQLDSAFNYSTEEQVIGEWIDRKPLYRKVVIGEITSYGADSYPHISTGIANLKDILLIEYTLNYGDNYEYYSSIKLQYYIDKNENNDIIFTSPSHPGIITAVLYYTKTTD